MELHALREIIIMRINGIKSGLDGGLIGIAYSFQSYLCCLSPQPYSTPNTEAQTPHFIAMSATASTQQLTISAQH